MASRVFMKNVKLVQELENRRIAVTGECHVRGEIVIVMEEDDARWFWASMDDKVKAWKSADGDD